jgi:hypothetical protein
MPTVLPSAACFPAFRRTSTLPANPVPPDDAAAIRFTRRMAAVTAAVILAVMVAVPRPRGRTRSNKLFASI